MPVVNLKFTLSIFVLLICYLLPERLAFAASLISPRHHDQSLKLNDISSFLEENEENEALGPGEENIGCLFSKVVCHEDEWCFNDLAFGRCLPIYGLIDEQTLYRYDLGKEEVHLLEREMEKLYSLGYRWRHDLTQCRLQSVLDAIRYGTNIDNQACREEADQDLEGAIKAFEDNIEPVNLAFIKYKPSDINPHPDYADEIFLPGRLDAAELAEELPYIQSSNSRKLKENIRPQLYGEQPLRTPPPQLKSGDEKLLEEALETLLLEESLRRRNKAGKSETRKQKRRSPGEFNSQSNSMDSDSNSDLEEEWKRSILEEDGSPDVAGTNFVNANEVGERDEDVEALLQPKIFSPIYNSPQAFRQGLEIKDVLPESENVNLNEMEMGQNDAEDDDDEDRFENVEMESPGLGGIELEGDNREGGLYESDDGSVVFLPPAVIDDDNAVNVGVVGDEISPKRYLWEEDSAGVPFDNNGRNGFERKERYDVKKPGPWYRTVNNFAFDYEEPQQVDYQNDMENVDIYAPEVKKEDYQSQRKDGSSREGKDEIGNFGPNMINFPLRRKPDPMLESGEDEEIGNEIEKRADKQLIAAAGSRKDPGLVIDTNYVNILLSKNISWKEGEGILFLIATDLGMNPEYFNEMQVRNNLLTFRVNQLNNKGINATEVAHRIDFSKDIKRRDAEDIKILSVGIGKVPNVYSEVIKTGFIDNNLIYIACGLTGVLGAIIVSAVAIFCSRKNTMAKEKFSKLAQDDPNVEACKDYQELCRARMASKSQEEKTGVRGAKSPNGRDSDNSSSSRSSSSSSWNDEPVLTNMDISTGHLVLAYMEDHLKNKDRLEQEWAALTAYEAEPNSVAIAEKAENAKKNRYSNALPFDHSRVILNDLANINASDYINASTITDHDPRNPSYITTQGPLQNTIADFWQLIWEQGSVVIVSLTRLVENGTTLCHRYWPDEGSELHHIYEVHLVSEHIWCEQYLVRSFYLKNLKTGETRTVTQFHFLAWPENGIPPMKPLLEFRRKVNKSYRGRSCPIIVHCSDGAGRSGTYCLIDMVLNRMAKGAKEIDIAASLEHIRDQRPGMVKTKQQFEFVLMSVAEEVHAILKALPQ